MYSLIITTWNQDDGIDLGKQNARNKNRSNRGPGSSPPDR